MEVSVLLGEQFIQSTIFCLDIDPSPRSKGAWFCVPVEVAVPGTPDKVPFGEACLTVTGTFPYLEGGWSIRDLSGKVAASGTWKSQVPACGSNTGVAALHATFPDENLGSLGDLTLYPTTGGMAAVEANLFAGDQQYSVSHPCVDIDLARSAPGLWFTVEASVWDPMSSVYKPAGALEIRLQAASPKRRGSWTLRGLAGGVLGSGDWEAFE